MGGVNADKKDSERKIDTIQEQTNQIARLLNRLTTNSAPCSNSSQEAPMKSCQWRATSNETIGTPSSCSTSSATIASQAQFEGESSLSAHTAFANRLIERAVSTAPLETFSSDMAATLSALRQLVETQNNGSNCYETTYRLARSDPIPSLSLDQNPMPPIQSVMGVLQLMKSEYAPFSFDIRILIIRPSQQTRSLIASGSTCT